MLYCDMNFKCFRCLCVFAFMHVCIPLLCLVHMEAKEGFGSLGSGATDDCELPCGLLEIKLWTSGRVDFSPLSHLFIREL